MLDVCCDPTLYDKYIAMVKVRNECQFTAYMSLHGNLAFAVCCAEVLFHPSFSLCRLTHCLRNMRHPTCLFWYGLESGARCVSRNVTRHRLSAYSSDSLTLHLSTAVCISQAEECLHVIHDLSLSHLVVSASVAGTTRCSL